MWIGSYGEGKLFTPCLNGTDHNMNVSTGNKTKLRFLGVAKPSTMTRRSLIVYFKTKFTQH